MKVPISKIGELQKRDIEDSSGIVFYSDIGRVCTVYKPHKSKDCRGDKAPFRMAELFGGDWKDYNNHFIVQASGCPLRCGYCYVDNLKIDMKLSAKELVDEFADFKKHEQELGVKLNVFHFMGGAPAMYCDFWPSLREELDNRGLEDTILFSDSILVENHLYGLEPWKHMGLQNFILTGDLKGTNRNNFIDNTGKDLFREAIQELQNYNSYENFYLTLIGYEPKDLESVYKIMPKERIDFLSIIPYEASKRNPRWSQ